MYHVLGKQTWNKRMLSIHQCVPDIQALDTVYGTKRQNCPQEAYIPMWEGGQWENKYPTQLVCEKWPGEPNTISTKCTAQKQKHTCHFLEQSEPAGGNRASQGSVWYRRSTRGQITRDSVFTVRKALTLTLTLTLRSRRVPGRILKQKIDKLSGVSTGSPWPLHFKRGEDRSREVVGEDSGLD